MPRESYAATVARHTAVLDELHMRLLEQLPPGDRVKHLRLWSISMHEINEATRKRIEASDYEAQRRAGVEIAETATTLGGIRG